MKFGVHSRNVKKEKYFIGISTGNAKTLNCSRMLSLVRQNLLGNYLQQSQKFLVQNCYSIFVFCDEIFCSSKPKAKSFCGKSLQNALFFLAKILNQNWIGKTKTRRMMSVTNLWHYKLKVIFQNGLIS